MTEQALTGRQSECFDALREAVVEFNVLRAQHTALRAALDKLEFEMRELAKGARMLAPNALMVERAHVWDAAADKVSDLLCADREGR
jgi:hypothetical protein